jgi:hypothetical protein
VRSSRTRDKRFVAAQSAGRHHAQRGVLEQLGRHAAHAQQHGRAQRIAMAAKDHLHAALDHLLHQEPPGARPAAAAHLGGHALQPFADALRGDADGHAADVALVRDVRRQDLQHHLAFAHLARRRHRLLGIADDALAHAGHAEAREQVLCLGFVQWPFGQVVQIVQVDNEGAWPPRAAGSFHRVVSSIAASALVQLSGAMKAGTPRRFNRLAMPGACGLTNTSSGLSLPGRLSWMALAIRSGMARPDEPTMTTTAS